MDDQLTRTPDSNRSLAARALLALQLVVLAVGVLQFALVPASIESPLLAAATLGALTVCVLLVRLIPNLPTHLWQQHLIDLLSMIVAITLLIAASGGVRSSLITLCVVPLAAAAIGYGRCWFVLLIAAILAAVLFSLGTLQPNIAIGTKPFGIWLVSTLAPGTAVALVLATFAARMQTAAQKISDLAATDAVTGLLNLRAFESVLQQEHRKAERFGRSYSLIIVDVDNVAQINESLGHEAGNLILNAVAAAITRSVRNSDVTARLGGDEFILLCVESDPEVAAAIAQRIRNNVYSGTVSVANRLIRANVSVGVANFPADHLYPKELMMLADRRMQQDRDLRREAAK